MKTPESPPCLRIAVVEDNAAFRSGLQALFELSPDIECAGMFGTAEEALLHLPQLAVGVVLLDINLPGMSGVACARELKQRRLTAQILMLTIEDDHEWVFAALRAGATGYLLKSATPAEILEGIHVSAQGGSPMSATIARRVVESFHETATPGTSSDGLTEREVEVLRLIAQGKRLKQVAAELKISISTVQTYVRRIYEKLQVHSQAEAVAKFLH